MSCPLQKRCKAYKEGNCLRMYYSPHSVFDSSRYSECGIYQNPNSVWLEKDIEYREVRDEEVIENPPFPEPKLSAYYQYPTFPLTPEYSNPPISESPNKEEYVSAELFLTYDEWKSLAIIIAHYIMAEDTPSIPKDLLKKLINIKVK